MNCNPSSLANAARCFMSCVPGSAISSLKTYLLCRIGVKGLTPVTPVDPFTPQNFNFVILNGMTGFSVATWSAPPAGTISTELWASTDNVNFSLVATVAAPGVTSTVLSRSSPYYGKIRFQMGDGPHSFTTVKNVNYGTTWSARVVANGGAAPAAGVVDGVNDWCDQMARVNMLRQVYCAYFPVSSITATRTAVIDHIGSGILTNHAFVGGDLTVNGLVGDAATKWFDTAFTSTDIQLGQDPLSGPYPDPTASFGMWFLDFTDQVSNTTEIGCDNGANYNLTQAFYCHFGDARTYADSPYDAGTGRETYVGSFAPFVNSLLFASNRTATNTHFSVNFRQGAGTRNGSSSANNVAGAPLSGATYKFWTLNAASGFSDKRGSFVAITQGLNFAYYAVMFNAVNTARVLMGGGAAF